MYDVHGELVTRIRAVGCGDGQRGGVTWRHGAHQVRNHRVSTAALRLVQGQRRRGQCCRRHQGTDTVQHQDHAVGFQVRTARPGASSQCYASLALGDGRHCVLLMFLPLKSITAFIK